MTATLSSKPMNLYFVEFHELYARHLCRHSQFGINVVHLIALAGIWYAVYGLLYILAEWAGIEWVVAIPALVYLGTVAVNVPLRVFAATALFLGAIVAAVILLPQPPFWVHLIVIPVLYKVQSWSHRFYTLETDMTAFNRKYSKGSVLFVVLLVYEVPIVLNYLLFDRTRAPLLDNPPPPDTVAANVP
jgi:hypothetical protein